MKAGSKVISPQIRDFEIYMGIGMSGIDDHSLDRLTLLDSVVKESLRLQPVVPAVARVLQVPMRFSGFDLPAHSVVAPSIYLTHQNPQYWPKPQEFIADRFVGKKVNPYEWLPFGGGIRRCIGMAFALYEMRIVLAILLSRMSFVAAPDARPTMERRGITFAPADGTRVVARLRCDDRQERARNG